MKNYLAGFSKIFAKLYFKLLIYIFLTLLIVFAFYLTDLRIQTTVLGYKIASLKEKEAELLEQRSRLKMEYAKLTSKENLAKKLSDSSEVQIQLK